MTQVWVESGTPEVVADAHYYQQLIDLAKTTNKDS